jgi:hypothetical protein
MAFGNITYNVSLRNYNYKYNNYTRNLVGRSFGRCLRNRLLSGSSMKFTMALQVVRVSIVTIKYGLES